MSHRRVWRVLLASCLMVLTAMLATPKSLAEEPAAAHMSPTPTPAQVLPHGLGAIIPDPGAPGR